jgi:ABC-type uncharacterized transport system substrate-binding protein
MPSADALIAALLRLQPGLTRVWVPWVSLSFASYMDGLVKAGKIKGLTVDSVHLKKTADLPSRLREATDGLTAILLPPDPELISRSTFEMLKQTARARKIPLYAPFQNLVAEGATASIGVSFRAMGQAAGAAARRRGENEHCDATLYPNRVDVRVSVSAALESGLTGERAVYGAFAEVVP